MLDRDELDRRIEQRVEEMISLGLVDEVQNLLAAGLTGDERPLRAIGYKEIVAHLRGEISLSEAVQQIKKNTRRYARRQLIWWRSDPRIQWIEASRSAPSIASEIVERACL
jgi:tRNA dimethylallyltransferase